MLTRFSLISLIVIPFGFFNSFKAQSPWRSSTESFPTDWSKSPRLDPDRNIYSSPWNTAKEPDDVVGQSFEIHNRLGRYAGLARHPDLGNLDLLTKDISNGTKVTVLGTVPDAKVHFMRWYQVRIIEGPYAGLVGFVSASNMRAVNREAKSQAVHSNRPASSRYTLTNSALILREPDFSKSSNEEYQLGIAISGSRVAVLSVHRDRINRAMRWYEVRFLDGQLAGKSGFVSASNIREDLGGGLPSDMSAAGSDAGVEDSLQTARSQKCTKPEDLVVRSSSSILATPKLAESDDTDNQIGIAITGTRVRRIGSNVVQDGALSWMRVRIITGVMQGREGWVSIHSVGKMTPTDWRKIATDHIGLAKNIFERNQMISAAYAKVYLKNRDFKWAGMAAFASMWVGWGMASLNQYQAAGIDQLTDVFGLQSRYILSRPESNQLIHLLAAGNNGLFNDIYWQHLAFDHGCTQELIDYAQRNGISLPPKQLAAWQILEQGINTANQEMIWEANTMIASYEQNEFLQSLVYDPAILLWEKISKIAAVKYPGFAKTLASPLPGDKNDFLSVVGPNANIANKDDRWAWIARSMLPHWKYMEGSHSGFTVHWLESIQSRSKN